MTAVQHRHMLRMQRTIAQLRMAVVLLLAGATFLKDQQYLPSDWTVTGLAAVALVYALAVATAQPYRRVPLIWWDVATGFIDWGLITAWILATGGIQSQFYLLYFLSVLSIAMRYGLAEVMLAGVGTALGYFLIALFGLHGSTAMLDEAALRMGHLLLFAFGSGLLARELSRHFRARLKEEAQRLTVQEVTATVSHDLKNPLNAIAGLIEMLLESAPETMPFEQRALLHRIDANARQMMNLIANLLDAELIEHGRQQFQPTRVDVNGLVRRVVEAQAHQAEVKHIGLVLNLSRQLPPAPVDGALIERLVANLLNNALKFTPEDGAVRVSTELRGASVRIEVWDSGPEVPASLRAALFEKYARQEDSPGIGLGLYICKSIVDMHQGEISVHNIGDGVSFVVELPVMARVRSEAQPAPGAEVNSYTLRRTQLGAAASR
jgi:signal transduction histidine kinase